MSVPQYIIAKGRGTLPVDIFPPFKIYLIPCLLENFYNTPINAISRGISMCGTPLLNMAS